jgi:hypothetical protein
MKTLKLLSLLFIATLASCSSVYVNADYDKNATFSNYKTYAYMKNNLDNIAISDFDKKRILNAIDEVMATKGFTKSESPDIIINIFTKERERVDIYQNYGVGWGWNPYWGIGMNRSTVTTTPEGTLILDFIDQKTKELVWQGQGTGYLTQNRDKKDAVIKEFVVKILAQYPPQIKKEN